MRIKIWKIVLYVFVREEDGDVFPCPLLGFGYSARGHGSTLLATMKRRFYYGPQLSLYFFLGPKILEISVEWEIDKPPTVYPTLEEARGSRR